MARAGLGQRYLVGVCAAAVPGGGRATDIPLNGRVLLTGGRAPASLELARAFQAAGHTVFMAESLAWHLTRPSRAVARSYQVPPPRQAAARYVSALAQIVERESIDLLVPTCEEIYAVARGRADLERGGACTVLAEPLDKLRGLHDKWLFVQRARGYGLRVPETCRLTSAGDLRAVLAGAEQVVLKPVYSRFANRTRLPPHNRETARLVQPSTREPWIAQAYVRGQQICTYSVAHNGRLAAHVAYPVEFSAGQGAAVAFRPITHPAAQAWVESFVMHESFTGQIAFDFIEPEAGAVVALECNPRSTSGVHLLAAHPDFARAFFGPLPELVTAETAQPAMLAAGMLLYSLPAVRTRAGLRRWAAAFAGSRDVVFSSRDPLPALLQVASLAPFLWWSTRHHMSAIAASTYDIEWNGE